MKANEAPTKIYIHVRANKELGTTWHGKKITNSDIEYVRKDAFIEKVEEYLYKQLNEGNIECGNIETFIENFKKYMKGE